MEYGGYGCLIILAGLLPQWIFIYGAAFYANSKKRQNRIVGWNSWQDRTRQLAEAGLVTGCVLLGNVCGELCQSGSIRFGFKNFAKIFKMITIYGAEKIRETRYCSFGSKCPNYKGKMRLLFGLVLIISNDVPRLRYIFDREESRIQRSNAVNK